MTKADLWRRTELALATMLILAFILPLTLTIVRYLPLSSKFLRWMDSAWIGRPSLSGVTVPLADTPLGWKTLASDDFQKSAAAHFNENFASREAIIRCTNEMWFRLFRTPANPAAPIAVGKDDVLFEPGYLSEYFLNRKTRSEVEPWVRDLRQLQDYCRKLGIGFVIVFTPSKASIYPEHIPEAWKRWYDPRPRIYPVVTELFRAYDLEFVDAIEPVAQEKAKGPPAPLFPKGGIHWNQRAALAAANAMHLRLARQNKPADQIEIQSSKVYYKPLGDEHDLVDLMNGARRWRYPVEHLKIKTSPSAKPDQMTAAMVADSFGWSLARVMRESGQYSEIAVFFHYWRQKTLITENRWDKVRAPATPIDFSREIFAADCLILVINEVTATAAPNHITGFLKDVLPHLPDPALLRPKFRSD